MSIYEYKRLEEAQDALWEALAKAAEAAEAAEAEGLVGSEESEKFLELLRHAET